MRQPDLTGGLARVDAGLRAASDPERAVQEKRYLKSNLEHLGASVPAIRKVAKEFVAGHPDLSRPDLLAVAENLWTRAIHEHRMCTAELLDMRSGLLKPGDIGFLERLLRESKTWALVDNLSANPVGFVVERYPTIGEVLDRWAEYDDFWMRRAAMLALLRPIRRGEGDFERFARYADAMLDEKEFFIRKAIGWVLRDAGKKRPDRVFEWLLPRARRAAGLTVREAIRYLPDEQQEAIQAARRAESASGARSGQERT